MSSVSDSHTAEQTAQPKTTTASFAHYFAPRHTDNFNPRRAPVHTMRCIGLKLEMRTGEGTFARGGLDAGSRLLIETFASQTNGAAPSRICDLGCGWGAIGGFVAAKYPNTVVTLADINRHAVEVARANLSDNEINNATLWCGDGLSAARSKYFEAVLCNPPVRAGNRVIEKLFVEAERCLVEGGALWVVLRTQQGARSWQKRLKEQFGNCEATAIESGYRVLKSVKCEAQSAR